MRIALGIEYCGLHYAGFQKQKNAQNIQSELEKALSIVANHAVQIFCAGRTDAGVHAFQQVIHFDSHAIRPLKAWTLGGNANLPTDIRILWAKSVDASFHARFSALSRRYQYFILNRKIAPAIQHGRITPYPFMLDEHRMHLGAQYLLGENDFTSFRAAGCQSKSCHRQVDFIRVTRETDTICIDIQANAFLYHMVRNIVGSLITVGEGKQPPEWIAQLLAAKDRTLASPTAPAAGLYFHSTTYPTGIHKAPIES